MQNFHVLTGAPGSGKSTVLNLLRRRGFECIDEPARQILAEQRSFDGNGIPDKNPTLFTELLLARHLFDYRRSQDKSDPLFFDRGIPDVMDYGKWYDLDLTHLRRAARRYRYAQTVFVAPNWEEIYCQDDERTMTFDEARRFGDGMRNTYQDLGYDLLELPREDPESRVQFILSHI